MWPSIRRPIYSLVAIFCGIRRIFILLLISPGPASFSVPLIAFAFDQIGLFPLYSFSAFHVRFSVEVNFAFDYGGFGHGVDRERMIAEDDKVAVFSDINRAGPLVDS